MVYDEKQKKKKSENISEWYNDIVLRAELADYAPVKGMMVIRPYGYAIWELIQKEMDKMIKEKGVVNAYFPLFIPMSLFNKEEKHVKGFSPELAVVTHGGGEELSEPLAVRPTSETIMYEMYKKWVQSWRDLPLLINQWNNVVRWEKRTYLFLRTSEFLWQEGHTAHATQKEAWEMVLWAANMYSKVYREYMALPGFVGIKSESEKFAGAQKTLTYEAMMPDGKALQSCTSHDLGQNFSKAFDISFQDQNLEKQFVWQSSWGLSTRSIGGLILAHGDDNGLRLPPRVAPVQVIIVPIKASDSAQAASCMKLKSQLLEKGVRAEVDLRDDESIGFKINKWELKGVPVRVEIGAKEIESGNYTLIRRDLLQKQNSQNVVDDILNLLVDIQKTLFDQAEKNLTDLISDAKDMDEFKQIMISKRGFVRAFWCEDSSCEAKIKELTKATTRCMPIDKSGMPSYHGDSEQKVKKCVNCDSEAKNVWLFAQAY